MIDFIYNYLFRLTTIWNHRPRTHIRHISNYHQLTKHSSSSAILANLFTSKPSHSAETRSVSHAVDRRATYTPYVFSSPLLHFQILSNLTCGKFQVWDSGIINKLLVAQYNNSVTTWASALVSRLRVRIPFIVPFLLPPIPSLSNTRHFITDWRI